MCCECFGLSDFGVSDFGVSDDVVLMMLLLEEV